MPLVSAGSSARAGVGNDAARGGAGATSAGSAGSAGTSTSGNEAGASNGATDGVAGGDSSSSGGSVADGGASGALPLDCKVSNPVSFQKDIQGFLATSCGKSVGSGCHVTDSSKTSLGYDHAYDWITAFAHANSCGKAQPSVHRFDVVLALLSGPKPPSCPNARQMPPSGTGAPLTACESAALQAWLAEPMVSQMHVPVNDDTASLYPPGPYLMPPFN